MILKSWDELPAFLRIPETRPYYDCLSRKKSSLVIKRCFDFFASSFLLILFSPLFLVIAIAIKLDSNGPVFYRQKRVTQYGREFRIHKFRSMIVDADKKGTLVRVNDDSRITRVGRFIREYRLDEVSQLIDIFQGNMSFVGTRPEVPKYVEKYCPEMLATLFLPAGLTSEASIRFKDEASLLDYADDPDRVYVNQILPKKMKYNLKSIEHFSLLGEFIIIIRTIIAIVGKKDFSIEDKVL